MRRRIMRCSIPMSLLLAAVVSRFLLVAPLIHAFVAIQCPNALKWTASRRISPLYNMDPFHSDSDPSAPRPSKESLYSTDELWNVLQLHSTLATLRFHPSRHLKPQIKRLLYQSQNLPCRFTIWCFVKSIVSIRIYQKQHLRRRGRPSWRKLA